jgi:hypothetical protein
LVCFIRGILGHSALKGSPFFAKTFAKQWLARFQEPAHNPSLMLSFRSFAAKILHQNFTPARYPNILSSASFSAHMQDDSNPSSDLSARVRQRIPPPEVQCFLVRCKGFRCMAYKDPEGRWRNAHDGTLLPEVLEILSDP